MSEKEKVTKEKNQLKKRTDTEEGKWVKKYVGGGAHFLNWLKQFIEIYGEENVKTEEIDPAGFSCYEDGKEKMFKIWVREKNLT
jgi:hypothetical protein